MAIAWTLAQPAVKAHRLTSFVPASFEFVQDYRGWADEIVVIDGGRVLEHGDRAQLEAEPGSEFRRLLDLSVGVAE